MPKRKEEEGGEAENTERWLLTYSDMITLLLALFIILFSMSSISLKKFVEFKTGLIQSFSNNSINAILKGNTGLLQNNSLVSHPGNVLGPPIPSININSSPTHPTIPNESQIAQQVSQALAQQGLSQDAQVVPERRGVVVRILSDQAFFSTDSAELGTQGDEVVDTIAKVVAPLPNQISVEGYTDNQPILGGPYSSNFELSAVRAVNVLLRLVRTDGINPDRLSATGYGATRPIVPNSSPANMAMNRRVDVVILNTVVTSSTSTSAGVGVN
ncbi:chemotaxis protein MotB [Ferrithrix thermotolerans DSM 19514]|jgi:chemotaxis protein MotB|uniref:Chemotaxis protein MotB n=1 Tax=Ferrithrix thermotolerans DSM 19514 TaxID=1121881 RepID=A0A1M4W9N2_9ACTN|nr:flagellar motor protein MotB [Ferrithrix thermotolerans]SHE77793.1 chemotaxis protein MotB [Ferrithrix thermotolerans DSM 19514]